LLIASTSEIGPSRISLHRNNSEGSEQFDRALNRIRLAGAASAWIAGLAMAAFEENCRRR
jgi:hypothetical protein